MLYHGVTMDAALPILVTLILYNLVLLAIGALMSRRTHDEEDYYLGGRRLGPLVASISAAASSSSAWSLLGVSGMAFSVGVSSVWILPGCVGGFAIQWYLLANPVRRLSRTSNALTLTDLLTGDDPGAWARPLRVLASAVILIFFTLYVAAQFDAAGDSLERAFAGSALSLDRNLAVIVGGAVVLIYTLLGGFWAVSATDTLQGLLMALTAVVLPVVAFAELGWSGFTDGLAKVPIAGFTSVFQGLGWASALGFVLGILGIGLNYPGQPHVVNRFMALGGGDAELRRARRIAMVWAILVYGGMILVGLCGRILLGDLGNHEQVFVASARRLLHPVLAGVMIAAVLSAIMSTADSQLLVAASAVTHDLRRGGSRPAVHMAIHRWVVGLVSLAALLLALTHDESIFRRVLFAFSAMGASFGPLLVVRLLRGAVAGGWAFLSMSSGLVFVILGRSFLFEGPWAGAAERVLPLIPALAFALLGARAAKVATPDG